MRLEAPYFLLLIPVVLLPFFIRRHKTALDYSNVNHLKKAGLKKTYGHIYGKILIAISLCLFVIALARPQLPADLLPDTSKGIDIAMVLDVSGSMESVDFTPNRLEVARDTIESFVKERYDDRIGFIIFGGSSYTRVPLTMDHDVILSSLEEVTTDSVSEEGTAIGMAVSVGINRLKNSDGKSKIMILVTDGDNNAGAINPDTASQLAKELGIKIYTIGVGTDQTIMPYEYFGTTQYQTMDSGLDEALLTKIADVTGGQYFRATDASSLQSIFSAIDQLEKTDMDRDTFMTYDEWAFAFIKLGLIFLVVGLGLDRYMYLQIP